jgi:transcriptional regulator with XRE-family HTH domain
MSINERLKAAAQAIDELFPDQAGARERYERLMTALQDSEKAPLSSPATAGSPATSAPQPAPDFSVPSSRRSDLSDRERKVIEVIRESVQQRGHPPSMREIGHAVGLSSTSSVAHQLLGLERKGYLRRDPHRPRSYEVPGSTPTSDADASRAVAAKEAAKRGWSASDQPPALEARPGEEALKEQVRNVWGEVEKLRRDSDEQRRYLHRDPLTDADLAKRIGKSRRTVSRWLRDKTFMPSRKDFLAIIELLGGDTDEFDFIWYEGYAAHEALKGTGDQTPTPPDRRGDQRRLISATDA